MTRRGFLSGPRHVVENLLGSGNLCPNPGRIDGGICRACGGVRPASADVCPSCPLASTPILLKPVREDTKDHHRATLLKLVSIHLASPIAKRA